MRALSLLRRSVSKRIPVEKIYDFKVFQGHLFCNNRPVALIGISFEAEQACRLFAGFDEELREVDLGGGSSKMV